MNKMVFIFFYYRITFKRTPALPRLFRYVIESSQFVFFDEAYYNYNKKHITFSNIAKLRVALDCV